MDARMPDLDGPDALAAIREAEPSARCFVMSGNPGAYCWESLARAGAERMFARPLELQSSSSRINPTKPKAPSSRPCA